jgi:hypothetical protein
MHKLLKFYFSILFSIILLTILFTSNGCSTKAGEGFAIYLTKDDVSPSHLSVLSHVDIEEEPLIGIDDIITYNAGTHEITLTSDAYKRIVDLEVPVGGRSFMVCVDKQPVYSGAFWVAFSSMSFDGITIWKPLGIQETSIIKLEPGYPSSSFFTGEDPRNNVLIIDSLKKAGKLTGTTEGKLPRSFKGYELYSWAEDGIWHFILITGTNRNKTLDEIISGTDKPGDGWTNLHVIGVDDIKAILSRLPEKEFVFWAADWRLIYSPEDTVHIILPDRETVDTIKEYAIECGLDFVVEPYES